MSDRSDNANDLPLIERGTALDPEQFRRCIHCGMCTAVCPTYAELGDENEGPRGRIEMMRRVAKGESRLTDRIRRHLETCLDCRKTFYGFRSVLGRMTDFRANMRTPSNAFFFLMSNLSSWKNTVVQDN